MGVIENKISQLENYMPELTRQPDFDDFWQNTIELYRTSPVAGTLERVETPISDFVESYDLTFMGHDQTAVHGWFLVPKGKKRWPAVVSFPGYTGGRGLPEDHLRLVASGFVVLAVDARGQGGDTGNKAQLEYGSSKGWVSQGILSPETAYYRALLGDAYRAVEWLREQSEVELQKIGVCGTSQGGGLALWTAALNKRVGACVANLPNMCHLDFGVSSSTSSLTEIADFIRRFPEHYGAVMKTLSYFDFMNIADKFEVPVMMSVGLKDAVCMPETIFAAYNRIKSLKEMKVYPFSGHSVGSVQHRNSLQFLQRFLYDD